MKSTYQYPEDEWNERLVKAMDDVIDEEESEPETDEAWVRCYEIACQRLINNRINNY